MTRAPTRVLYLAHTFGVGGAEEMALNLMRHLPERFAPAACAIGEAGALGRELRETGASFAALGLSPGLRRPSDLLRLRDFVFTADPAIVHTFLLTASLYGRLAALLAGVPIVIGTEVNVYAQKRPLHRLAERWLMRGTDAVVTSAASVREFYVNQIGADPAKVEVIYNAVDWSRLDTTMARAEVRRAIGVPDGAPAIGIIARLTEQKAHRVLFDAVAGRPDLASVHVVVVGDGELAADLRRRATAIGLNGRVHFLGARRDLGNLLSAFDVFVMPSLWEGLPLSLVLAMGAGLPVVATRVAGIPEVVEHETTGLLVEPGDAAALGGALARVVHDRALAVKVGRAAREYVRPRFGVDGYVASTAALYDRLLARKGLA